MGRKHVKKNLPLAENHVNLGVITLSKVPESLQHSIILMLQGKCFQAWSISLADRQQMLLCFYGVMPICKAMNSICSAHALPALCILINTPATNGRGPPCLFIIGMERQISEEWSEKTAASGFP